MSFFRSFSILCAALLLSLCLPSVIAKKHKIPIRDQLGNSTQEYVFKRKLSWTNSDFNVTQIGNNTSINGTSGKYVAFSQKLGLQLFGHFKLYIKTSNGTATDKLTLKINTGAIQCGFSQTYKMSNGVQFFIATRGWYTDRWYIKKSGIINQKYTYFRASHANKGFVKSANGTKVAHFDVETYGSEALSSVIHETFPGATAHRILTNGEVPIEILSSLYIASILRVDKCHW